MMTRAVGEIAELRLPKQCHRVGEVASRIRSDTAASDSGLSMISNGLPRGCG
jgi:hypothetical protein